MLTLKAIRKTALYKALMEIPGVELMEIDKELQAASSKPRAGVDMGDAHLDSAMLWYHTPQGYHFWGELFCAQDDHAADLRRKGFTKAVACA